jgi:hypothetical protein
MPWSSLLLFVYDSDKRSSLLRQDKSSHCKRFWGTGSCPFPAWNVKLKCHLVNFILIFFPKDFVFQFWFDATSRLRVRVLAADFFTRYIPVWYDAIPETDNTIPKLSYTEKSMLGIGLLKCIANHLWYLPICLYFWTHKTTIIWYIKINNTTSWNTKWGSITVLLTSCLTGLESGVWQFLFLFAKLTYLNRSNRRSTLHWYYPL